jgi:hypothetical protein
MVLAMSGLFLGAALSARRRAAPTPLVVTFLTFSSLCAVLAVLTFHRTG